MSSRTEQVVCRLLPSNTPGSESLRPECQYAVPSYTVRRSTAIRISGLSAASSSSRSGSLTIGLGGGAIVLTPSGVSGAIKRRRILRNVTFIGREYVVGNEV